MSQPIVVTTSHVDQTVRLGATIGGLARPGDVIALLGELGAGKTQLTRGIASGLGIDSAEVSSPTFTLIQEYAPGVADGPVLVHIDAYRLAGPDELDTIGWIGHGDELRENAVVVIEWAERVDEALEDDCLQIAIRHHRLGRSIAITPQAHWSDRLKPLEQSLKQIGSDPVHSPHD